MPNTAYLIATELAGPVAHAPDRDIGYANRDIIARAPVTVPVFWLAMFEARHLATVDVEYDDGEVVAVPSLVDGWRGARERLESRSPLLLATFPEFAPTLESFRRLLDRSRGRYLKVHLEEIWMLVPHGFEENFVSALRWFDTLDTDDRARLMMTASIEGDDPARRTFSAIEATPRAFHLRGYAWDDDWDNEADI